MTVLDGGLIPTVTLLNDCNSISFSNPWACSLSQVTGETVTMWAHDVPPQNYIAVVDGLENTSGSYRLDLVTDPSPSDPFGATCANEPTLSLVNGAFNLDTHTGAAVDDGNIRYTDSFGASSFCGTYLAKDRNFRLVSPGTTQSAISIQVQQLDDSDGTVMMAMVDECRADGGAYFCRQVQTGSGLGTSARYTGVFDAGIPLHIWVEGQSAANQTFPFRLEVRTAPAASVSNDVCSPTSSPLLTPNTSFAGTTLGANDDYGSGSDYYGVAFQNIPCPIGEFEGADVAYRFTAPTTGLWNFNVQPTRGFFASGAVLSACDPHTCLGMAGAVAGTIQIGQRRTIPLTLTAGQTVFLMVDTIKDYVGTYDRGGFIVSVTP